MGRNNDMTQREEGLAQRLGGVYAPTRNDVSEWLEKSLTRMT